MGTTNVDLDRRTLIEATANGWWYSSQLSDHKRVVVFHTDDQDPSSKRARKQEGFLDMLLQETVYISHIIENIDYRVISGAGYPRCTAAGSSYLDPFGDEVERWCAIGDAAIAFDPLSSQGMITALRMGGLLGIVLSKKFERLELLRESELGLDMVQKQNEDCRKDYEKKRRYFYRQCMFSSEFWQRQKSM